MPEHSSRARLSSALLLAAFVLLAWNPYTLRDPGFELSFVAVVSIFVLVRPLMRVLEGYPVPHWLAVVQSAPCVFFATHVEPLQ